MSARKIFVSIMLLNAAAGVLCAEENADAYPSKSLETILNGGDITTETKGLGIRLRHADDKKIPELPANWAEFIEHIAAHIIRALVIAAVIALLVVIILYARRLAPLFKRGAVSKTSTPARLEREKAAVLLERARAAYTNHNLREAWTLCFRAALAAFEENGIRFPQSATEYECLRIVNTEQQTLSVQFKMIVDARIAIAYRTIEPEHNNFEASAAFCSELIKPAIKEHI